ncbi:MAG: DNA polymerase III subunit chi [Burkholderiaceae bacterium]
MTEVIFHFNVPDRTAYACRLLRKATRSGARVVVTAPVAALTLLDRALWRFDPLEFIPHLMAGPGEAVPERLRVTPVWLLEDASTAAHHDVLVNLGVDAPSGFEAFARLIEIVSTADDDRSAARLRLKHYAARGYPIRQHEASS